MKIELTKSQISYLKSLDSKKKKRKFLLDCLVENVEVKIDNSEIAKIIPTGNVIEDSINLGVNSLDMISKAFKAREAKELIAKSNEVAKLPTYFCVKITDKNRDVLEKVSQKIRNKTCKLGDGFLQSNSLITYVCVSKTSKLYEDKEPSKIVTTDEFLKYIGREDLIEKKSEQGSELLKFDILQDSELMNIQRLSINDIVYNRKVPYAYVTNELMNFFKEIALNNINKYNENAN
jgi:hypothetical protein